PFASLRRTEFLLRRALRMIEKSLRLGNRRSDIRESSAQPLPVRSFRGQSSEDLPICQSEFRAIPYGHGIRVGSVWLSLEQSVVRVEGRSNRFLVSASASVHE